MAFFTLINRFTLIVLLVYCSMILKPSISQAAIWSMPPSAQLAQSVNVQDGDLITDDGGLANSYSSLYRASLVLVPPPGMVIELEFQSFDLESDFDHLVVFNGPSTGYPPLMCQTSGTSIPANLTGTHSGGMTLFLSSDGSVEGSGFVARVRLVAAPVPPNPPTRTNITLLGHDTMRVCNTTLFDSGGPNCTYLHNTGYILDATGLAIPDGFTTLVPDVPNHVIQVEFTTFDVENSTAEDFLAIYDGSSNQAVLLGEFQSNPGLITADNAQAPNPDGSLTLWFVSDFVFNRSGFEAQVRCIPRPNATITGNQTICAGENAQLTIQLSGTPPFNLVYEANGQMVQVNNILGTQYSFTVNPGIGLHIYSVVSISDANLTQLRPPLSPSSATVEVLAGPLANFARPQYQVCSGNSVELEINLTGSAPYEFSYSDGSVVETVSGHMGSLYRFSVSPLSTTTFSLQSISDSRCPIGRIVQGQTQVIVSPPPAANLVGALASGVCPGGTTSLRVDFSGSGPWELVYTDGQQNATLQVLTSPVLIPVQPSTPRTYSLVSVTTPNCPPGQVQGTAQVDVFPLPNLMVSTAVSCDDGTGQIELKGSVGTAPYEYSFDGGQSWGQTAIAKRPPSPQPYAVAVRDANGCLRTGQALVQGLPAPRITDIVNITASSMTVFWSAVPGTGVYYSLRYRIANTTMPWISIPFVLQTFRNIAGLQSGTTYEFEVKVFCAGDLSSDWSNPAQATTLQGQPADCALATRAPWPIPGGFYYDQLTSRSVRLNWNSVAGPGYIVAWGLAPINPNNWPQDVVCNTVPLSTQSQYIIYGLTPGTTYRARVRTNCSNCTTALQSTDRRSAWTQIIEFTTPNFKEESVALANSTIELYPNPSSGQFYVFGLRTGRCDWHLVDVLGRTLLRGTREIDSQGKMDFNLNDLENGIYFLVLKQQGILTRFKLWFQ
jgi:hypothetical protein